MRPAFSVVFLTTLIGAGQGLFLALYCAEIAALLRLAPMPDERAFFAAGCLLSLGFSALGLGASFAHLGHPERAWRAAAMWRTSWLSREVIALPAFMGAVFLYGAGHYLGSGATPALGALAAALCLALFVCTGMIYACLKFLQQWASPLTVVNYLLLGCASGFTLAAAFAVFAAPGLTHAYALAALVLTLLGLGTRAASLVRNSRIKPRSSVQSAIGVRHPHIRQKAQGFMGGSFNTREFFHGRSRAFLRHLKWLFLTFAFAVPALLLAAAAVHASALLAGAAFVVQFPGLIAERWFFFAEASHPQNLYYQAIS